MCGQRSFCKMEPRKSSRMTYPTRSKGLRRVCERTPSRRRFRSTRPRSELRRLRTSAGRCLPPAAHQPAGLSRESHGPRPPHAARPSGVSTQRRRRLQFTVRRAGQLRPAAGSSAEFAHARPPVYPLRSRHEVGCEIRSHCTQMKRQQLL